MKTKFTIISSGSYSISGCNYCSATTIFLLLSIAFILFLPRPGESSTDTNYQRNVYAIDLTRLIEQTAGQITVLPTVYRLEESLRLDSRVLVNTVDVKDTRRVTSALLPRGFINAPGGIDSLQGRRAHAFVAPVASSADSGRYQWTHEDFQQVTQHSVVVLMDSTTTSTDGDHEHDLLTPEATDCLINDKKISVLITNHRYIDGRREQPQNSNYSALELKFLNSGVVVIVSAASLSEQDAEIMGISKTDASGGRATAEYEVTSVTNNKADSNSLRQRRQQGSDDFGSFFYAYFHVFQPDRTIPVGLAAVTLLNFTSQRPISLSHEWFPKDGVSSSIPLWPGTLKPIVRVTLSSRGRSILFSEQQAQDINEQHPSFFTAASPGPGRPQRPSRPYVRMKFAEHFGTHIDAPFHMLPNGTTMAALPKGRLFSNCCYKVDLSNKITLGQESWATERGISVQDYENYAYPPVGTGCLPLFFTGTSRYWRNNTMYVNEMIFPGISPELASLLFQSSPYDYENPSTTDQNIGVGIDTLSIDPGTSADLAAHVIAAANGAIVLENLANLNQLPDGGKPVPCLIIPLKIDGGSGSPAKVVAFLGGVSDVDETGGSSVAIDSDYDSAYSSFGMAQTSAASQKPANSSASLLFLLLLCYNFFLFT